MKRIIFVDDEINVLKGLQRMLRSIRRDWDMTFAESATSALDVMEQEQPFDVVVTDVRMPGMDGIAFLKQVKERYPHTVRIILSGNADSQTMFKAASITHQYLNKPCDAQYLHNLIARVFALRDHLNDGPLKRVLHDMGALPSAPALYNEVLEEIQSEDPSVARVGEIIEQDLAMSAKILQIVNSAFIGLQHHISSVTQAAALLGMENIRNLVLVAGVFAAFDQKTKARHFSMEALWNHSLSVAQDAMKIVEYESDDKKAAYDAFTAGLLHDVGLLVLSAKMPAELDKAYDLAKSERMGLFDAERETFQASHAQAGGYLLELWGLPDPITEAVTFHDLPSRSPEEMYTSQPEHAFSPLLAVHIANYFCDNDPFTETEIDDVTLQRLNLSEKVETWWDLCHTS